MLCGNLTSRKVVCMSICILDTLLRIDLKNRNSNSSSTERNGVTIAIINSCL